MFVFQRFLGLLLVSSQAAAFVAKAGLGRPVVESVKPFTTPPVPTHEHSTSLHEGVSYIPPMKSLLVPSNVRFASATGRPFFDVDPTFTAMSIAYDATAKQEEMQRRKVQRSVAASTAVVCAIFMAQKLTSSGAISYLISQLPHFYRAYPLPASIATCTLNSVLADFISQVQIWKPKQGLFGYEWKQFCSNFFYGSTCIGIGSNLMYTKLLPAVLAGTSGLSTILASALMDTFAFAPLIWLPSAYAVKAVFQGGSVKAALGTYVNAVRKEKLLHKYATFWLPAQCITFGCVPKHLRVVSTAGFGFLWFLILAKITSDGS